MVSTFSHIELEAKESMKMSQFFVYVFLTFRVWVGSRGIRVWPGNKDQDSQRHHAGGAFPDDQQRIQDVQDEAAEGGEVHLREQSRHLQQWVYGESIVL